VKNNVKNLGFDYVTASSKVEFKKVYNLFLSSEIGSKPMVFEVFTNNEEESAALEKMLNIEVNIKSKAKKMAKQLVGSKMGGFLKAIKK